MELTQILGLVFGLVLIGLVLFLLKQKKSKPSFVTKGQSEVSQELDQITVEAPNDLTAKPAAPVSNKGKLAKSQSGINATFNRLFSNQNISAQDWQDLEDALIMADVGAKTSTEIVEQLKKSAKTSSTVELKQITEEQLTKLVSGGFDRTLKVQRKNDQPAVVLTVGVNGTGKTTTTGKLARKLVNQDLDVVLGAADTFRAAAAEQLTTWADRIGVQVIRGGLDSDPAAVAFEAVKHGIDSEVDVVIIDTAGRLHTKQGLMDELGKVYRVASKSTPIDEILLVIDATTGQNGLNQARVFAQVVPVTGIVLTKLDGTAKGGIVIAVQQELGVPVKLVGLGEGPDDLAEFNPTEFVSGLID